MRHLFGNRYIFAKIFIISIGITVVCLFPVRLQAQNSDAVLSRPAAGEKGVTWLIRRSDDGIWNLISIQAGPAMRTSSAPLYLGEDFRRLSLFSDGGNRFWLTGEKTASRDGLIQVGRLDKQTFIPSLMIGLPDGWNRAADLCFPRPDSPWIAWIHQAASDQGIFVQDVAGHRRWRLSPPESAALSAPRITVDGRGGIWVLWAGRERGGYIVAGRRYDGREWSKEIRLAENGERPCLQLEAFRETAGSLRAVWSAYDGRDYEIFTADFDGDAWSPPRALTDDPATDENPRIVELGGGVSAVAWASTDAAGTRILASIQDSRRPARPVVVSPKVDSPVFETAGTDQGFILIREDRKGIRLEDIQTVILQTASFPSPESPSGPLFISPFNEAKYTGFGDSITYGYIDRNPAPEKGYIPRLDIKLDAAFGPTDVLNAGSPGELTAGGLSRIDSVLSGYRGRYILVMEGTNDVKVVTGPIEASVFNLKEICLRCRAAGAMPLLSTVIPRRDYIWDDPYYQDRHNTLNASIRSLAVELVIPFVDMEKAFLSYPGGPENLLSPKDDWVHPNEAGYVVMTETWYSAIRGLPFPPLNVQVRSKSNIPAVAKNPSAGIKPIPLSSKPPDRQEMMQRTPVYAKLLSALRAGNLLFWQANPKTADPSLISGYRIYRKKRDEPPDRFLFLGFVKAFYAFFDGTVEAADSYEYIVATLGINGAEGPCSEIARIQKSQ